ncbi:MAG: ABC transporter ATP-binding protein [Acidimicrobiales bacterium]
MSTPQVPRVRLEGAGVDLGGSAVLDGVDLVLEGGEAVALTGPSGSGKTVLCLLLAGVLEPARGRMWVELGRPARAIAVAGGPSADGITTGLILQTHGLVSGLTAEENVALPLQSRKVPRDEATRRTARALADVGLTPHAARPVDELSGGERQRVGIARALASDPAILIADEPTAELDPGNRNRVLDLLSELARVGRIVVIASDDPEVVAICHRVLVLDAGRIADDRGREAHVDAAAPR